MSFRVMARTVIQLGAELISSDGIAFYELIKNAFDAGSPRVDIDVLIRLPYDAYISHVHFVQAEQKVRRSSSEVDEKVAGRRAVIVQDLDPTAPGTTELAKRISRATTWEQLLEELDKANRIDFGDFGSGMTRKDLQENFLTIGTRSRLIQLEGQRKKGESRSPILGEKGLGRLSAMRLGWMLRVESSTKGEENWNLLRINWRLFSHESDSLVEEIPIKPTIGKPKEDPKVSGTLVRVYGLTSRWSEKKLKDIASSEFSRLTDPFVPKSRYPISLRFNDQSVPIPSLDKILFDEAHAVVKAEYTIGEEDPALTGQVNYVLRNRQKTFSLGLSDLTSIAKCDLAILEALGPFSVEFYWFNRRILEAVEGIGDKEAVRKLVNEWSGGLMVFRDGFRVNPYGSPDDDWLDLDRKAFASSGYKVNRKQIIGRVCISRWKNPELGDQTNRQGIRDSDEKAALINLLKHLLEAQFRTFLNTVDDEVRAKLPVNFDELDDRMQAEDRQMRQSVSLLLQKYPQIRKDTEVIDTLEASLERIESLLREARQLSDSFERGRLQLVNLAGLGLMVEILAHELNRATHHALSTLAETDTSRLAPAVGDRLSTLKAQLKTLQKRLRILDPLSHPGRQVKESFDLIAWVEEIVSSHEAQFRRHAIKCSVGVEPSRPSNGMEVRLVKGMVVQIIENLLSNSVYWLKQQRKLDKNFSPKINIIIDTKAKEVRVTDNGPGIPPERSEEVFQPFVTTKPPGEGKGLGLYISREIAHYHGAALILSDKPAVHKGRLNTFNLILGVNKK